MPAPAEIAANTDLGVLVSQMAWGDALAFEDFPQELIIPTQIKQGAERVEALTVEGVSVNQAFKQIPQKLHPAGLEQILLQLPPDLSNIEFDILTPFKPDLGWQDDASGHVMSLWSLYNILHVRNYLIKEGNDSVIQAPFQTFFVVNRDSELRQTECEQECMLDGYITPRHHYRFYSDADRRIGLEMHTRRPRSPLPITLDDCWDLITGALSPEEEYGVEMPRAKYEGIFPSRPYPATMIVDGNFVHLVMRSQETPTFLTRREKDKLNEFWKAALESNDRAAPSIRLMRMYDLPTYVGSLEEGKLIRLH